MQEEEGLPRRHGTHEQWLQAFGRRLTELLVDFVFHRQAVAVPTEAARHVVPRAAGIPRHNVLAGGTGGQREKNT